VGNEWLVKSSKLHPGISSMRVLELENNNPSVASASHGVGLAPPRPGVVEEVNPGPGRVNGEKPCEMRVSCAFILDAQGFPAPGPGPGFELGRRRGVSRPAEILHWQSHR